MLAIASGDVKIGEKLPSVRELAIRFKIHQNTVSHAYQQLEAEGWVESRKGSGVFARELSLETLEKMESEHVDELERLAAGFFKNARALRYTDEEIRVCIEKALANPKPDRIIIAEENTGLQKIIFTELNAAISLPLFTLQTADKVNHMEGSLVVAMPATAEHIRHTVPANAHLMPLKLNSALSGMSGYQKPAPDEMIGIVSGWDMFQQWAKTFLLAVGIDGECIVTRNPQERNFKRGLESCSFLIADSAAAVELSDYPDVRTFRLIADEAINEIQSLID